MGKIICLKRSLEANILENLNLSLAYYIKRLRIYFSTTLSRFLQVRLQDLKIFNSTKQRIGNGVNFKAIDKRFGLTLNANLSTLKNEIKALQEIQLTQVI